MEDRVEYEQLLPYQFAQRLAEAPLCYVPIGSLEWHGEHMAVGNDAIKMHGLCCEAARISGGVVFPPLFFGIRGMTEFPPPYDHSANQPYPESFVYELLMQVLQRLEEVGFLAAIVVTGHTCGEQRALVRRVADDWTGQGRRLRVLGTDDASQGNAMGHTSDHAAKWETSILMALRPELVEIERLPRDYEVAPQGVFGDDPRLHASAELGRQAVAAIAALARLGRELLAEAQS